MIRRESARGWTLLEMLAVMTIAAIVSAGAMLNIGAAQGRILAGEGERLAALLSSARDESVLANLTMRVRLTESGYRFEAERNGASVEASSEDLFRPRVFPEGIRLESAQSSEPREGAETTLIFTPWGDDSDFDLLLTDGRRRARVRGDAKAIHAEPEGA